VRAPDADQLRAWLADPTVADVDPLTVARLRERLAAVGDEPLLIAVEPHGTLVVREPSRVGAAPRRILELDRNGAALTVLRWTDDGRLAHAWIKIADDSWVMIEPRATYEPRWGLCDRLWHAVHPSAAAHVPLTAFEALAYEAIGRIPVVMEPARLPAGAGAAVLNLVAALAADAGRARLEYRGPYPTEQLFVVLLESFRHHAVVADATTPASTAGGVPWEGPGSVEADPLAAFMGGRLEWSPAPHERACPAPGVTVHLRGRVEKVVWRERLYYRGDWQGVHRHAPRRVRDVDGAVVCSLWALGEAIEDHLRLDPEGTRVEVIAPSRRALAPRPLPPAVLAGVASAAAALSAAPLAPFIREIAAGCELTWASLDGHLVAVERTRLSISHALRDVLARRFHAASTRADRLALALVALTELAHLLGDSLRSRAQSHLANLPAEAQANALTATDSTEARADDARRIAEALESLIADTDPDQSQRE
jgi:hypothetical protein